MLDFLSMSWIYINPCTCIHTHMHIWRYLKNYNAYCKLFHQFKFFACGDCFVIM